MCSPGRRQQKTKINLRDEEGLYPVLDDIDDTKKHIVFLDGVTADSVREERACFAWMKTSWSNRRLVMVTAMASRIKVKLDDDANSKVKEHFAASWALSDYLEAVKNDDLFESVKSHLDASDEEMPSDVTSSRESLVEAKYYFAGGSARHTFDYRTAIIMESLNDAVDAVTVGEHSANVINRLYGRYGDTREIISRYAASALVLVGGWALIKIFASALRHKSNAVMDGWILEMYLFACIRESDLILTTYEEQVEIKFPKSEIVVVDPKKLPPLPKVCWLKPKK